MKKLLSVLLAVLFLVPMTAVSASADFDPSPRHEEVCYSFADLRAEKLGVGEMIVCDFGALKLHAYNTNDPLADVSSLIETDTELIGIEAQFLAQITELCPDYEGVNYFEMTADALFA